MLPRHAFTQSLPLFLRHVRSYHALALFLPRHAKFLAAADDALPLSMARYYGRHYYEGRCDEYAYVYFRH